MAIQIETLLDEILDQYQLEWYGIHGIAHWGRVLENGLRLAESNGADRDVVTLFALFHDACRVNDGYDPGHGKRGAELASKLRGSLFELSDEQFTVLVEACTYHTDGMVDGPITVRTCWDSDRLDLGRVGVRPDPERLCTEAAKSLDMIDWANQRAVDEEVPESVTKQWNMMWSALE